jgi:hypothetical protein
MPLSGSARALAPSRSLPPPKPIEGRRKIVDEVVCLDNAVMRPMPNGGLRHWRELEHLVQRLGHVLRGHDIDKKFRDTGRVGCIGMRNDRARHVAGDTLQQ